MQLRCHRLVFYLIARRLRVSMYAFARYGRWRLLCFHYECPVVPISVSEAKALGALQIGLLCPRPRRGGGGIRRSSASVVRPSVCLMSRTFALTRKPKGLGRRNFAQGYPRSHATPTPTSRSKGQKSRSRGGAYCGGHLAAQLVITVRVSPNTQFPNV